MLSFQIIESGKAIQIDRDAEGISLLLGALARLVGEQASHCHLRTPSCGGSELTETTPWGEPALNEVIISYTE